MSRLSDKKRQKIKEEVLRVLYESSPLAISTFRVSEEVIRDNEFILGLIKEMERSGLVVGLRKNKGGKKMRVKWRLSDKAFKGYRDLLEKER
jgi:hypothetical protein